MPDTGSAYGGKHTGDAAVEAPRLAKAAGKPVKVVWTREEEFTWAYLRPAGIIDIKSEVARVAGRCRSRWRIRLEPRYPLWEYPVAPALFILASAALLYYTFHQQLTLLGHGKSGDSGWDPDLLVVRSSSQGMSVRTHVRNSPRWLIGDYRSTRSVGTFTHLRFSPTLGIRLVCFSQACVPPWS